MLVQFFGLNSNGNVFHWGTVFCVQYLLYFIVNVISFIIIMLSMLAEHLRNVDFRAGNDEKNLID